MAQFRGVLQGQRGEASRLGNKKSGLKAILNGWNVGVNVYLEYDETTGKDKIRITRTGGSNNGFHEYPLIEIEEN